MLAKIPGFVLGRTVFGVTVVASAVSVAFCTVASTGTFRLGERLSLEAAFAMVGMRLNLITYFALVLLLRFLENLEVLDKVRDRSLRERSTSVFLPLLLPGAWRSIVDARHWTYFASDALLRARKSETQRTRPSFLGTANIGETHSERPFLSSTP
jgi:hypothetical protein